MASMFILTLFWSEFDFAAADKRKNEALLRWGFRWSCLLETVVHDDDDNNDVDGWRRCWGWDGDCDGEGYVGVFQYYGSVGNDGDGHDDVADGDDDDDDDSDGQVDGDVADDDGDDDDDARPCNETP